jgi:predicted nuclease of restriction endonuclease-like (RecB) superfamily
MAKKRANKGRLPGKATTTDPAPRELVADLRSLIESARGGIAQAVNSALVLLYWRIGHRIRTEILKSRRAAYGQEILSTVSKELVASYGNGDFLGLKDSYGEQDLEAAILREMERFLLELGAGFAFIARQKRFVIDGQDHYLDLLFYHRKLRRLVAVELKLGRFKAADKGQMELYLVAREVRGRARRGGAVGADPLCRERG